MSEELYQPPEWISSRAHIATMEQYREMYERSINNPEEFWAEQANHFCWFKTVSYTHLTLPTILLV